MPEIKLGYNRRNVLGVSLNVGTYHGLIMDKQPESRMNSRMPRMQIE